VAVYEFNLAHIASSRALLVFFKGLVYTPNEADCGVISRDSKDNLVAAAVYVDDLIVVADMAADAGQLLRDLSSKLGMINAGNLQYMLGLGNQLTNGSISLIQHRYIDAISSKF
jgi:Reverse transcriptase (RNA-dependent DNA polymerase)